MSHVVDGLIVSMTHINTYGHPSPTYGAHQYPQLYGGASYYPPPTHQQSYLVGPSQMLGAPPPAPMMHLVSQPGTISPQTPTYNPNIGASTSNSYTPYGLSPQNNPYFPFPSPPDPLSLPPQQTHDGINFFQPSPIQQVHSFEQLNMENPTHQSNNAKKKGKN
jgi:hypothetical protein